MTEITALCAEPRAPLTERVDRYCIIGAGPSGLAAARAFNQAGIPFDVLERHADVGGIWDLASAQTPMYETAHFISSRTQSAFSDFPMPEHYPDYPSWRQILEYLRDFARHYDLRRHIQFGADVRRVMPAGDQWDVVLASGEHRRYRGVVLAVGHNWDPVMPTYPGHFDGVAYHAFAYRSPEAFGGKRVLVVGGGNSGCDIACDAAANAEQAMISLRRGYYFLPKHIFGQPTDVFFRQGPHIPLRIGQPLLAVLLRLLVGDLRRYGLPRPDHKVLTSHPIVNSQLLHYLAHGDIVAKPDVRELRGGTVVFTDGSEAEVDVIVYATGYQATIPCFDDHGERALRPDHLFLNIFPASYSNLFVIGQFETDGAAYPVVSRQAELVARVIALEPEQCARWLERARSAKQPDLTDGVRYLATPRHAYYVQFDAYNHHLDKLLRRLPVGHASGVTRGGVRS
ncbi:MAG TPA: NAD(P)-binding domain-containing protein [Gemmatimonadaceae bacterium]|nr:NAD(P)-binding domain-containing protein [Gemmatimonadaceae bacterium]